MKNPRPQHMDEDELRELRERRLGLTVGVLLCAGIYAAGYGFCLLVKAWFCPS